MTNVFWVCPYGDRSVKKSLKCFENGHWCHPYDGWTVQCHSLTWLVNPGPLRVSNPTNDRSRDAKVPSSVGTTHDAGNSAPQFVVPARLDIRIVSAQLSQEPTKNACALANTPARPRGGVRPNGAVQASEEGRHEGLLRRGGEGSYDGRPGFWIVRRSGFGRSCTQVQAPPDGCQCGREERRL